MMTERGMVAPVDDGGVLAQWDVLSARAEVSRTSVSASGGESAVCEVAHPRSNGGVDV
ncbi:hypothetical protein AB0P37_34305 [Streptomyces antimycoticus]|uniref:hypothetical protein n=1 Tax=Streptomyces antimycoticus TaxID=68175 RepID=UPI003415437A